MTAAQLILLAIALIAAFAAGVLVGALWQAPVGKGHSETNRKLDLLCIEVGDLREKLRLVREALADRRDEKLTDLACVLAIGFVVLPQPEPTAEDIAWAKQRIQP